MYRRVIAVRPQSADENAEIIDRVTEAVGTLDEALKPVLKTLEFKWKRAFAAAKVAMISLGETLAPVVRDAINQFKELIDQFQRPKPRHQENGGANALLLGPALIAAGIAAKGLSIALGGFALFLKPYQSRGRPARQVCPVAPKCIPANPRPRHSYHNRHGHLCGMEATLYVLLWLVHGALPRHG